MHGSSEASGVGATWTLQQRLMACFFKPKQEVCFVFNYLRGARNEPPCEKSLLKLVKCGAEQRVVFSYLNGTQETPAHGSWQLEGNELRVKFNGRVRNPEETKLSELVFQKEEEGGRWLATNKNPSEVWFVTLELVQHYAEWRHWRWGPPAASASVALAVVAAGCRQRQWVAVGTLGAVVVATGVAIAEML